MDNFSQSKNFTINYFSFEHKKKYPITIRPVPSSDIKVFHQIFLDLEYKALIDLIKQDNKADAPLRILDAGGNIGLTSIYMFDNFPNSRIIIVEPDDENFKILKTNIKQNKIINSHLVKGGIWYKDTSLNILRDESGGNDWAVRVEESDSITCTAGFSIKTLIDKYNFQLIDVLKIDIEGSERHLFKDPVIASEFLTKTRYISIEIHDQFNCRKDVYRRLEENNFEYFNSGELTIGKNMNITHSQSLS